MRKCWKSILVFVAIIGFINAFSVPAQAAGPRDGEIIDGSLLTSDSEASAEMYTLDRSVLVLCGKARIANLYNNGCMYIYGSTLGNSSVDRLRIYIYLEKLNEDDVWELVYSNNKTLYDDYYIEYNTYVTNWSNYYYRVKVISTANMNSSTKAVTTITNGIYVGQ